MSELGHRGDGVLGQLQAAALPGLTWMVASTVPVWVRLSCLPPSSGTSKIVPTVISSGGEGA